jgi:hypothetical protein
MPVDFSLFSRKLQIDITAGFLTCSLLNAFPSLGQWPVCLKVFVELTAAGTVADLHGIPF